jgi:hypothetical protein
LIFSHKELEALEVKDMSKCFVERKENILFDLTAWIACLYGRR